MKQRLDSFIPENIGRDDILFENLPIVGRVDFMDGAIVLMPFFVFTIFIAPSLPGIIGTYSSVISLLVLLLSSMILIFKPNHQTISKWLRVKYDFEQRENEYEMDFSSEPIESYEAVPDDDTRKLTKINKVFPNYNTVELNDGTYVSAIQFTGANLDMASSEQKQRVIQKYAQKVGTLDKSIQFYMPMRPVDLKETKKLYEDQLDSKSYGVNNVEFMEDYIKNRTDWLERQASNKYIREYYVIVRVEDRDIHRQGSSMSKSSWSGLPGGELIEDLSAGLKSDDKLQSEKEMRRRKLREISKRREDVGSLLSVGPQNSYSVVQSDKLVGLLHEFWNGKKVPDDELSGMSTKSKIPVNSQGDKHG